LWLELVAKCAFGCNGEFGIAEVMLLGAAIGMNLKERQYLVVHPWILQI
jgi:hypothetical protein